ncbi:MAG: TIGR02217 family protein [Pikeienuella sp.]
MSFHDVLFPAALSFGSSGGPERRTEIIALANGFEERNATWAHARRRYDAGLGLRRLDDIHEVVSFFEARRGMLHSFRWKDWADCKSCAPSETPTAFDQPLGIGDGERRRFTLARVYASGGVEYSRPVTKPRAGSVRVGVDGAVMSGGFSVDFGAGLVSFADPPAAGAVLTAGFEFHVPARFDTDRLEINLAAFEAGEIPSIPIIEVRV